MHSQSFVTRAVWAMICAVLWTLSWIIAEGIPVFNDVLGLAVCTTYPTFTQKQRVLTDDSYQSSLFASWFSFGLPGLFWLYLNRSCWFLTWRQTVLFCLNIFLVFLAFLIVSDYP